MNERECKEKEKELIQQIIESELNEVEIDEKEGGGNRNISKAARISAIISWIRNYTASLDNSKKNTKKPFYELFIKQELPKCEAQHKLAMQARLVLERKYSFLLIRQKILSLSNRQEDIEDKELLEQLWKLFHIEDHEAAFYFYGLKYATRNMGYWELDLFSILLQVAPAWISYDYTLLDLCALVTLVIFTEYEKTQYVEGKCGDIGI